MMREDEDIEQWLRELPLVEGVEIEGEIVYLDVRPGGAELGVYLIHSYTQAQLHRALEHSFASAINYDAGLGQTADGRILVLTQWLPQVSGWGQAAEPLGKLLNQIADWRTALIPLATIEMTNTIDRNEQRLRSLFAGTK